eukprot:761072-Hanusia_phi.AAC.3
MGAGACLIHSLPGYVNVKRNGKKKVRRCQVGDLGRICRNGGENMSQAVSCDKRASFGNLVRNRQGGSWGGKRRQTGGGGDGGSRRGSRKS